MIDLTEQWKKGELKVGEHYFIRLKSGKIIPQMYSSICIDGHHCTDFALSYGNVQEVLAPVPSYDHFVELTEKVKENQQLKELLKECKPYISYSVNKKKYLGFTPPEANILTKIDNAIGEKK